MRLAHATALLATCAALALTGCDSDDTPGPPDIMDAGDTTTPTVTGTTPASDEAHVSADSAITVRFGEPMKSDRGTVRIAVDGAQRTLGMSHWKEEGRAFMVHPAEPFSAGARVQVTVEADFEDVAGNRLAAPLTFHFTVHGMAAARPHVTASQPAEGAAGVLPVELHKADATNLALRKVLTLTFNEPMDASTTQVTLRDVTTPANAPRMLMGTWSSDGLTLTVAIPRPESDLPPLEQENRYTLDVTTLRSATGQPVDTTHAGLGDGKLDFTTGRRDANVEHACTHALLNPPQAVTAGSAPTSFYPATDTGHTFYGLTLPSTGTSFRGYTEVVTDPDRDQTVALYLSQSVPVAVHDTTEGEALVVSTLEPAAPVCLPAITHVLKFSAPSGDRFLRLTFGPTEHETLTFVFERY
ncbi:Ig-like domain-containing protein [Pyxidicoccus sp. MSG2]|uniref:Ig-like domain-containing protein n=1 Tax=Pyxidicoccus sp. MSG2 TaxID=2996790 RepID=UPI00226D647A|nr:Ig-like domain-containing protein [Pyxidicoccus sp. MSG2]MCY1019175.1 Ig-like domain-containing protein [Pyxidicoccus sp. MSG2]